MRLSSRAWRWAGAAIAVAVLYWIGWLFWVALGVLALFALGMLALFAKATLISGRSPHWKRARPHREAAIVLCRRRELAGAVEEYRRLGVLARDHGERMVDAELLRVIADLLESLPGELPPEVWAETLDDLAAVIERWSRYGTVLRAGLLRSLTAYCAGARDRDQARRALGLFDRMVERDRRLRHHPAPTAEQVPLSPDFQAPPVR